jgi:amidohydrolase
MFSEIKSLTQQLAPQLLGIRRHIHAHPELSGHEHQTAAYVAGLMTGAGLAVRESVGRTGVVAELAGAELAGRESGAGSRCLAVRTDMDGLPIEERSGLPFASQYQGIMHACGHDVHTTIGLGTAMVLARLAADHGPLPGTLRFLFQPAEEIAQGARWMVDAGAIEGVEAIFGVHVFPSIPGGQIGLRCGALTAAADDLEVVILGEAGHGARPHEAVDAIWIAAQVITQLQQAIGRTQNPLRPVVLTIGKIQGGRAHNIIADQVTLTGTVRSLHPDTHRDLPGWIENIVASVCQMYGARYQLTYSRGVPSVQNDPALNQLFQMSGDAMLGASNVLTLLEPSLGAEDFAVYLDRVPGAMFRLGVGCADRPNFPLHHPQFVVDEQAIVAGVAVMAGAVWRYWQG